MLTKYLFRIIAYFFSACLACLLSIGILAATPAGSLWLMKEISQSIVKSFHYRHFSGALLNHFSLTDVSYTNKHYEVKIDALSVQWQPLQLLHFYVHIDQCLLSNVQVHIFSTPVEKSSTAMHWPVWLSGIQIDLFQLQNIAIEKANQHFSLPLFLQISAQAQKLFTSEAFYAIQIKKCHGVWQGHAVNGSGAFRAENNRLTWENCHFKIANALIDIDGVLAKTSHLIWHISIPDLAYWLPESKGKIISQGDIAGDWQMPGLQAFLDINQLQLGAFSLAQAHVTANRQQNKPEGVLECSALRGLYKNQLIFSTIRAHFSAYFTEKQISIKGQIESDWGKGSIQGNVPGWQNSLSVLDQAIQGTMQWQLNTFPAFNNAFIQNLQGAVFAEGHISGTVKDPKIKVAVHLEHVSAKIVPLNIVLKNITLSMSGWFNQVLKIIVAGDSTEGHFQASGTLDQLMSEPHLILDIIGKELLLADLPAYKIWASTHVQLDYQLLKLKLTGSLSIPKAKIKLIDYDKTVIQVSPDVHYVDGEHTALKFFSDVTILLGDAIDFQYGGLSGLLNGQLTVHTVPDMAPTGTGEIHLKNGLYAAYGQSLAIQQGAANFRGGDLLDPELNIKASKLFTHVVTMEAVPGYSAVTNPDGSLTVGISITGPVSHYNMQLFSDPAGLSQTDILSYLILGVPASNIGSGGGQLLLSAASALSDKGGNGQLNPVTELKNQLQETLGIGVDVGQVSQYNTSTQSVAQGTGLILTKRLSPKLSARYSAGIGQAINQFEIRYQINKNWMTQTNSSNLGNGGDIFYTINRY